MQEVKELEKIKNEYRNIPVPCDGAAKLQPVMERAKVARRKKMRVVKYGYFAAAAAFLLLLIPGMRGVFLIDGAANGSGMAYDAVVEKKPASFGTTGDGWLNAQMDFATTESIMQSAPEAEESKEETTDAVTEQVETQLYTAKVEFSKDITAGEKGKDAVAGKVEITLTVEEHKAIDEEIVLQMESRPEEFYEFVSISKEQDFYLDEEGCLVVVFPAGSLAAEEYGDISFIIPADVFSARE